MAVDPRTPLEGADCTLAAAARLCATRYRDRIFRAWEAARRRGYMVAGVSLKARSARGLEYLWGYRCGKLLLPHVMGRESPAYGWVRLDMRVGRQRLSAAGRAAACRLLAGAAARRGVLWTAEEARVVVRRPDVAPLAAALYDLALEYGESVPGAAPAPLWPLRPPPPPL